MDLNTASLQAMAKLVGVGSAYDLYLWRPYLSWEEVAAVPGFDRARIEALKAAGAQIKLPGDPRTRRDEQNLPW
jgi:DNA uptake protein ComE-like DNA-binding protein